MRHFAIALFAVALLLTAAHADDWSKTYTVEHAPRLRVDTSDADIRLDTWDQNKIEAHVVTEHLEDRRRRHQDSRAPDRRRR